MAIESSVGSLVGGAIGTAIAPGVGTQVGAGLGGALGGVVGAASKDVPEVQREDPAQAARLAEIDKTRRQISAGTDPLTQARVSQIQKAGETTKGQLAKFSGGDVGGTISSLLRAQRNIGQGANQAFTESQQRIPFFENLSTQLGNRIAQRKLELDINAQDQAKAEKAQAQKDTQNAISGTLGFYWWNSWIGRWGRNWRGFWSRNSVWSNSSWWWWYRCFRSIHLSFIISRDSNS